MKLSDPDRFWEKVSIHGPDECWPWTGGQRSGGYGAVWIGEGAFAPGKGKTMGAHEVALTLSKGPIPEGMCALHTHDYNRLCCNPAHLYAGTRKQNAADRKRDKPGSYLGPRPNRYKGKIMTCTVCGRKTYQPPSRVAAGKGKTCSVACANAQRGDKFKGKKRANDGTGFFPLKRET